MRPKLYVEEFNRIISCRISSSPVSLQLADNFLRAAGLILFFLAFGPTQAFDSSM
jgi:hypothetical protein